jgi:hypothetical protein
LSSRKSDLSRLPQTTERARVPNTPLRSAQTTSAGANSAVNIDDVTSQRIMGFKNRLRTDRLFLHEFYSNPIAVLDRELGIRIDPRSRIATELLATLRKKGESGLVPPPEEFNCYVISWGKSCIVVAQPEAP